MEERRRSFGVASVATLLGVAISVGASGAAWSQSPSSPSPSPPVVSPFFIVPTSRPVKPMTLARLSVIAVTRNEQVTSACSCGTTTFVPAVGATRVTLQASPPLRMRSSTRVIVGVTAKGSTGRWIVFGVSGHHYRGFGHGCMPAAVTALTPAEAANPSTIRTSCGPPSPQGTEYVYWNGTDHQLYELQFAGSWGPALAIGSGREVRSSPSVIVRSDGQRDVFWKGAGGRLWVMSYTGFWSDATEIPQAGRLGSGPSATVDSVGIVHVFWKGTDKWLWEMSDYGGVWSLSDQLNSGPVGSAPAVVTRPDDTMDLFWKGTDRQLWRLPYRGTWGIATAVSGAGKIGSEPAAVLDGNVEDLFWRGPGGHLWELSNPDSLSSSSTPLNSGTLGSAPFAVVHPNDQQDVFWKGTGGGLREKVWSGDAWGGAVAVPHVGKLGSQPVAALRR